MLLFHSQPVKKKQHSSQHFFITLLLTANQQQFAEQRDTGFKSQ